MCDYHDTINTIHKLIAWETRLGVDMGKYFPKSLTLMHFMWQQLPGPIEYIINTVQSGKIRI